jgi:hypothetical protein
MKKLRSVTQTAALLAFTGSLAVFAPSANAAPATGDWGPAGVLPGAPGFVAGAATVGDATFQAVQMGGGQGSFTFNMAAPALFTANLNFNPGYTNTTPTTFQYTLTSNNGMPFVRAGLTSQMQAGLEGGAFTKKVCTTGFGTGTCTTFTTTDTGSTGALSTLLGTPGLTIWVEDTYSTTVPGAQITGMSNSFTTMKNGTEVPGPLPLLGAGAAFGFSRKLRNRMKLAA